MCCDFMMTETDKSKLIAVLISRERLEGTAVRYDPVHAAFPVTIASDIKRGSRGTVHAECL
jgi:hypothetical protein